MTSHASAAALGAQHTLKDAMPCAGTGLHSGERVAMTLHPAGPDHGIVFQRQDIPGEAGRIPARWDLVADTRLCTRLVNEAGYGMATVEHLLAACAALGLDNALIEVAGAEIPIMDGSAASFVTLIEAAGLQTQAAARRGVHVTAPITVRDGDKWARLSPPTGGRLGLTLAMTISYDSPAIGTQARAVGLSAESFKAELQNARTFGFYREVAALQRAGLALGGNLANALVVEDDRVLNDGGLRYSDEFVRHKLLDAVGDLFTAGLPVLGHYESYKAGHGLNNALLRTLFEQDDAYRIVGASQPGEAAAPAPARLPQTALA